MLSSSSGGKSFPRVCYTRSSMQRYTTTTTTIITACIILVSFVSKSPTAKSARSPRLSGGMHQHQVPCVAKRRAPLGSRWEDTHVARIITLGGTRIQLTVRTRSIISRPLHRNLHLRVIAPVVGRVSSPTARAVAPDSMTGARTRPFVRASSCLTARTGIWFLRAAALRKSIKPWCSCSGFRIPERLRFTSY